MIYITKGKRNGKVKSIYKSLNDLGFLCLYRNCNGASMTNIATHKDYQGKNVLALMEAKAMKGYSSDLWGTFLQWKEQGRFIRKGERGVRLQKFSDKDVENSNGTIKRSFFVKCFTVFNFDQTETMTERDIVDGISESLGV